jgi:hypothetical protein
MLYFIAQWFHFAGLANLVRYQTFRAGAALMTALIIGLIIGPRFITMLRAKQGKGQPIREDGPQSHLAKRGTPTMGGLMILISLVASMLLWMDLTDPFVWACLAVTIGFGVIGFLDDYDKVTKRSTKGVSSKVRLIAEFVAGVATWIIVQHTGTNLYVPFLPNTYIPLSYAYYPFAAFVIGAGNAVNLTDGLDGLATMPVIIAAGAFAIIAYLTGRVDYTHYLGIPHVPRRRTGDPLRRDHGRGAGVPVVQRAAGRRLYGRHRLAGAGRCAGCHRGGRASRIRARDHRRPLRDGGGQRDYSGVLLQAHRAPHLPHGADPPPLRAEGLGRIHRGDPLLDRVDRFGADRPPR